MSSIAESSKLENKWWIKWWVRETLTGSLCVASLEELGFLVKICCLSKQGNFSGQIKASETEPLSHSMIAGMMQTDLETFERLLSIHKEKSRISEDAKGIITINNYMFYQDMKGKPVVARTRKSNTPMTALERDARARANAIQYANEHPDFIGSVIAAKGYSVTDTETGEVIQANEDNL